MITHYWLDDPSVPFATLLLLVGTHCHPDAGPDAYTNLVTLARTRDDEEMRRFKTELRQALLGRTGGLHPDALFTQPRTATAPTTRSSRDSGGISNLTTPTHTTYSGSTPSTTSCHPRPVAPRRSSSTGGPTPTPTASGTTCSSLSDSSTPAASPLLRHGARHPRHPALDLPSWHDYTTTNMWPG